MARDVPPEVVIFGNGDDAGDGYGDDVVFVDPDSGGRRRAPRASSGGPGRWVGLAAAVALVFGFGAAVGSHGTGPQVAGTPLAATTLPATTPSAPPESTASTSGPEPSTTSSASPPSMTEEDSGTVTGAMGDPVLSATDMCGQPAPAGSVTGAQPLPGGAKLNLIAGAEARVFSPGPGPELKPLVAQIADGAKEFVSQIAGRGGRYIATVASCADRGGARFVEITAHAGAFSTSPIKVTMPAGAQVGQVLAGGKTPWALVYLTTQAADGSNSTTRAALVSLDGSSRVVELPSAFWPVGVYQNYVVGTLQPVSRAPQQGTTGLIIQVFDITKGTIVRQLDTYVARYVIGDGYLLWEPQCPGPCEIHRYDIATGKGSQVGPPPDVDNEALVTWGAVSPDGKRIAMFVPQGKVTQLADNSYQIEGTSALSLVVLDVETGTTSTVRGIDLPWPLASVEFSSDSQWLVVALATRSGGAVVAYDSRMRGPYQVASLPDAAGGFVPLAVLPN